MTEITDEAGTIRYTYDANGNVLETEETDGSGTARRITRAYDCMNRVTAVTDYKGDTVKYGYDELGNLISITYAGGEIVRYAYYPDGSVESCTYDDRGWLSVQTVEVHGEVLEQYSYTTSGEISPALRIRQAGQMQTHINGCGNRRNGRRRQHDLRS